MKRYEKIALIVGIAADLILIVHEILYWHSS